MGTMRFAQIHPRAFAHPFDRGATSAFEQLPLLPDLLKKIAQLGIEERFRAHHRLNSVKLGPNQIPSLWRMVQEIADLLGIPVPETYLTRNGGVNAFAFGRQKHSIVLTSELVDLLSDIELRGVIAHEMGHILCQHMLYMDVGLALSSGAVPSFAKLLPLIEDSVASAFFHWFRSAEYSADRAALLILGDSEPLAQCLCRLAGVPRRFEHEFDIQVFADQAQGFDQDATWWTKVVTFGMGAFLTHPEPARRVGAVLDWFESDEYKAIRSGRYLTWFEAQAGEKVQIPGVKSCPLCLTVVGDTPICPDCGLDQDLRRQRHCPHGHVNDMTWRFCRACGERLN